MTEKGINKLENLEISKFVGEFSGSVVTGNFSYNEV